MNIKVIIENGENGYFVAHVPALKGCWSQGKTKKEALENVREAIDLYLEPELSEVTQTKGREIVELAIGNFPYFQESRSLERLKN